MTTNNKDLFPSSTQSVRKRLRRDITLLVLVLISLFLVLAFFYTKQIQKDVSISIIESSQNWVIDEIKRLFEPVNNTLDISKKWAQLESLTPEDHNSFNKRFIPILETLPQISGVILAASDGREYYFTRQNDQWLSRYIHPDQADTKVWQLWSNNNQLLEKWQEQSSYQSKTRPWYQLATNLPQDRSFGWTKPYSFYTQQVPGVTGVSRWKDENNITYILAFDVTLSNVAETLARPLAENQTTQNEIAFLISPDGEVILPPGNNHIVKGTHQSGSLYAPANDSHNYVIFDSVNTWIKQQTPLNQVNYFHRDNQTWWYQVFPLDPKYQSILAGVVVAEKSLDEVLNEKLVLIILAVIVLTVLAVLMANILVKKYSHQLKDVPKTSISKDDFSNEIYQLLRLGESETLEFKSTMRLNLKSGKNGKEIEIAWLKGLVGFMNTRGGILLIGVDDEANILGIEADKFENEDKIRLHFKNLISQHIGLEFSNFIQLTIDSIEGKTILVVECERANRPVFLFNKKEEDFYIRSGPASVKLSVSKVIRYVQSHY